MTPLERLAALSDGIGRAMLASAGCAPAVTPHLGGLDPALWYAGRAHASAVAHTAGEPQLLAGLDPAVASAATTLGLPTELMLLLGGDDRQLPVDGRNSYGMPIRDPAPVARLSSSTATPPDAEALAAADAWRRDTLARVIGEASVPAHDLRHDTVTRVLRALHLPVRWADRVVLSPSGTDIESLITAIVLAPRARPVLNVLVGAREAGSGSQAAASARWFRARAPFGPVQVDAPIDGFDHERLRVIDVDVRDRAGRPRRSIDVEAEIDAHLRDALDGGADVVVHLMAGSKTEIVQPTLAWVREVRSMFPARVRVVADAAQGRLGAQAVRTLLDAGASVFLTGSKMLSGPPFCGLLLLDSGLLSDVRRLPALPSGLARSVALADLPPLLHDRVDGWEPVNLGLHARWAVALAEWEQLLAWPTPARAEVTERMLGALRQALSDDPRIHLLPDPGPEATILSFLVRAPSGDGWATKAALADVYEAVIEGSGVYIGQPVEIVHDDSAALRVSVGASLVNRLLSGSAPVAEAVAGVTGALVDRLDPALTMLARAR